jgi:hypothetical protein
LNLWQLGFGATVQPFCRPCGELLHRSIDVSVDTDRGNGSDDGH